MTDMEREVVTNTANIAFIMKMFYTIMGAIFLNIGATILGLKKNGNGKSKK